MTEKKYTPQARYVKTHTRRFSLNANVKTDTDIIDHLDKCENVQGYLKALIRADMAKQQK